jgi:hypothetical protein
MRVQAQATRLGPTVGLEVAAAARAQQGEAMEAEEHVGSVEVEGRVEEDVDGDRG